MCVIERPTRRYRFTNQLVVFAPFFWPGLFDCAFAFEGVGFVATH